MHKPQRLAELAKNCLQYMVIITLCIPTLSMMQYSQAAEKKKNNTAATAKSDTTKFDELKITDASIWRCENNVIVKTAESTQGYLMLWNKKLYVMNKIDALRGVQRYTNDTFHLNWIEIPDKAMLFDFKLGQRVLDYCKTPELVASGPRMNQEDLMK
jgi:hypothetical protein